MKKIEEIFEDVCNVIENSTGYKKEDINKNVKKTKQIRYWKKIKIN